MLLVEDGEVAPELVQQMVREGLAALDARRDRISFKSAGGDDAEERASNGIKLKRRPGEQQKCASRAAQAMHGSYIPATI